MSVGAFISNPINQYEAGLYIPVATEAFFHKVWLSGSKKLKLNYIPLFAYGIDIKKEDLSLIKKEFNKIRIWAKNNLAKEECKHLVNRINYIDRELPKWFLREDTIVFIG